MTAAGGSRRGPRRVLVVGAGFVGLSCAWSLLEHGVEVTVADRGGVGAGASWQNAGYLSPALAVPLPEPAVLRYGIRSVLSPRSPVRVLIRRDPQLAAFLAGIARHCTASAWERAMAAYRPLNDQALEAFRHQVSSGVRADVTTAGILACCRTTAAASAILHELEGVVASGQQVSVELLTGEQVRAREPHLSRDVTLAVEVRDQAYITPSSYVTALAASVRERGGRLLEHTPIDALERRGDAVVAAGPGGELDADAAVIASGAWLSRLGRPHGVRTPVYGGRGYSFTLSAAEPLRQPTYFPAERVALTPQGDRVRAGGIMELGSPDAPLRRRRFETIAASMRPLVAGLDWDDRRDEWMMARPLSTDGLPLIGESATPGIYVAGGHGMWGVTLGPLTGQLLARQIVEGARPAELAAVDPLR